MTGGDDRRLRTAIAVFDAVMGQSQLCGPAKDAIDVFLEPSDDEASQVIKVTYTTNSVVAWAHVQRAESSIRQGPSAKASTTIRLIRPADPAAPILMEIGERTEPFDPSEARKRIERVLTAETSRVIQAGLPQ